jgi:magnesium-transporting ATPase (P-type)
MANSTIRSRKDWNQTITSYSTFTTTGRPPWMPRVPESLRSRTFTIHKNPGGARDLSASFYEHTWNIDLLAHRFLRSNIDVAHPKESKGLYPAKAKEYLDRYGPNELPKPKEISNLKLFFKQFANLLWILLLIIDLLSLIGFIADPNKCHNYGLQF